VAYLSEDDPEVQQRLQSENGEGLPLLQHVLQRPDSLLSIAQGMVRQCQAQQGMELGFLPAQMLKRLCRPLEPLYGFGVAPSEERSHTEQAHGFGFALCIADCQGFLVSAAGKIGNA